ncbi:MAG: ORF6N domain-containing protein [Opitutae bacterium]|nr:ORF6N domain-containing protein [Opitutae bacterium]
MPRKIPADPLAGRIFTIRGQRVILDSDLARLYGVATKVFNQAIKRNASRFPKDFGFRLTKAEYRILRSQNVAPGDASSGDAAGMWSQSVTTSKSSRRRVSNAPWVFTEHGAVMAANVLRSAKAVQMSVYVVRAFVAQREALATNQTVLRRLAEIDRTLLEHDAALRALWGKLRPLLIPPPEKPARELGFHAGMRKP